MLQSKPMRGKSAFLKEKRAGLQFAAVGRPGHFLSSVCYIMPWASIASATFMKPAILAPFT